MTLLQSTKFKLTVLWRPVLVLLVAFLVMPDGPWWRRVLTAVLMGYAGVMHDRAWKLLSGNS